MARQLEHAYFRFCSKQSSFLFFLFFLQIASQMGRALLDFVWAVRYHVDQ